MRKCCLIASKRFLNVAQPEEQHGFRGKYNTEKHTSTANLLLHKTADANAVMDHKFGFVEGVRLTAQGGMNKS